VKTSLKTWNTRKQYDNKLEQTRNTLKISNTNVRKKQKEQYQNDKVEIWRKKNLPEIECDSANPKCTFKKGYLPNWTEELFTVVKCIETRPPVYLVKDDHGEILEGTFYAEELQKVIKTDGVYKIETILKKRKKGRRVQYLV